MSHSVKKALKILIPLLLAVVFGWFMFSKIPIATIIPYFKSANYSYILLGVFLGVLSHLSRAYRWKFLLEPMGYKVKLPNSIMAVFITYLANYGIPRSGEVLRAAVLTNYENVPFEKGFGTIVAERIADLIVMLGIIILTLIFQFEFIYELLENAFQPIKLIVGGILAMASIAAMFIYIKKSHSKIALKIKTFLSGLTEGLLSIFKMKYKWSFIFHTLFIWAMYILMFYVTSFALNELHNASLGAVIVAFIAASFTIAATNGGVFFYPAAVLGAFLLFGLPKDASYAFGWIIWSSQTLMVFIFGVLSFIFLPIYNRNKTSENPT
ncbi:lysylphosphatidylglycerol synthase transmembrane domain-containing protein [Mariniflexile rhizosphaerae]|uniref:lysylphosphatidylglycerol synthase transmembrane domain-containing protein n=1 Tax=unclassified Mariniflexile TaxID=2643887 RepID=UPI000CB2C242|nr:lysylphosphatidylglycerol synthase transmembrane domain-containing protein [Mariniflexile sp. TRM1-10]PLB20623.1 MAG: Integral membrane protein [Flavobacteriaceae bacterium FS1-H7996/R]